MGQLSAYRRHLDRLKERRNDPFYQKQAKFLIRSTAPEYQRTADQYQNYLNREDMPEELKAQATINQQQNWANIIGGISDKMEMREGERRRNLEDKIENAEFQYEMAKEQEEEQKKDMFGNIISTVGKVAGAGVSLIPGIGLPLATAIGTGVSAIGSGVGAAVSGSPQMQYHLINESANEIVGGISASATLSARKDLADTFLEGTKLIDSFDIDPGLRANLLDEFTGNLKLGNGKEYLEQLKAKYGTEQTGTEQPSQIDYGNYWEIV